MQSYRCPLDIPFGQAGHPDVHGTFNCSTLDVLWIPMGQIFCFHYTPPNRIHPITKVKEYQQKRVNKNTKKLIK